jgi:hypothetical protein
MPPNSAFVGTIMKIVKLNALSNRGDYTYNTVGMFTWITVECVLVDFAASVPLLRPLVKRITGAKDSTNASYELPRYGPKGSNRQSSGFSKLSASTLTGKTTTRHVTSDNDTGSEDNILAIQDPEKNGESIVIKQTYSVEYGGHLSSKSNDRLKTNIIRPWSKGKE